MRRKKRISRKINTKYSNRKSTVFNKIIIWSFALTVFCIGGYLYYRYDRLYRSYRTFEPEFAPGDLSFNKKELNFSKPFTLLLLGLDVKGSGYIKADAVFIAHYDIKKEQFKIFALPEKNYYYSSREDGYFTLSNLFAYGQLQTPETGLRDLLDVVEETIAMKIDGYVALDIEGFSIVLDSVGTSNIEVKSSFSDSDLSKFDSITDFKEGVASLSPKDMLGFFAADTGGYIEQIKRRETLVDTIAQKITRNQFARVLSYINRDNTHFYSNLTGNSIRLLIDFQLEKKRDFFYMYIPNNILVEQVYKGEIIRKVDLGLLDKFLSIIINDPLIDREQGRIEVYNGTSVNGLASRYARWIVNSGGDVIRASTTKGDYERTVIFCQNKDDFKYTLQKLQQIFPDSQVTDSNPDFTTTGDIVIILGNNTAK